MANAILMVNPELNVDDVTVVHSTAQGSIIHSVTADAGNTGGMELKLSGDPGDAVDHTLDLLGTGSYPQYAPDNKYAEVETVATQVTKTVTGFRFAATVAIDDVLYVVAIDEGAGAVWTLSLWKYDGTNLVSQVTHAMDTTFTTPTAIAACQAARVPNTSANRIAVVVSGTDSGSNKNIRAYSILTDTNKISDLDWYAFGGGVGANRIAIAFNGAGLYCVLIQTDEATPDVRFGIANSVKNAVSGILEAAASYSPDTFADLFGTAWGSSYMRTPAVWWSDAYNKFLAAVLNNNGAGVEDIQAVQSKGSSFVVWTDPITGAEKNLAANNRTITAGVAIAAQGRHIFLFWVESTNLKMTHYRTGTGWNAILDAPAAPPQVIQRVEQATEWRGEVYVGCRQTATDMFLLRRVNALTATNTGFRRTMVMGSRNFLAAAARDALKQSLWFTPLGEPVVGDGWTISTSVEWEGKHTLRESLDVVWRTDDNGTPTCRYDAGANKVFVVDLAAVWLNLPNIYFEMDDASTFNSSAGSPQVSQLLSAVVSTVTVSSVAGNRIVMTTSPWRPYQLSARRHWIETSAGIFKILENGTNWVQASGNPAGATGTATVYRDWAYHKFSSTQVKRHVRYRVGTARQHPDNRYEVARGIFGPALTLATNYRINHTEIEEPQVVVTDLRQGSRIVESLNTRPRRAWELEVPAADKLTATDPVRDFLVRAAASQIVWLPDGDGGKAYLARIVGPTRSKHLAGTQDSDRVEQIEAFRIEEEV